MHNLSPTKLKELCDLYGLKPSKKYGQNYLISFSPIEKMIEAAELSKDSVVVEVGPGFGVLTFALAQKAGKVIAYEIERKLQPYWEEKIKEFPNVEIVWGNALEQLKNINEKIKSKSFKIIANLPYQITSHALRTFLEMENKPESIVVMVQKEVAERICAKPGDMSVLAVSVQYYGEPKIVTKVPAGNFWPKPKVDSAVLVVSKIGRISRVSRWNDEYFFKVVKAGFAKKRKQLIGNLSGIMKEFNIKKEDMEDKLLDITGNKKVRAEELGIREWEKIVEFLAHKS